MPSSDEDQPGMQEAIQESLRVRDGNQATQSSDQKTEELDPPVHTCQNRVNIDDRINDMTMQSAIELPIVHDSQGDTLIYIDAPQRQPEQDEHDYERYIKRYEAPIVMQKDTLTRYSTGLAKLFSPTLQYRFLRRRKLANKLPSNIKYVIDLTPPSEGEDAVFLTTELCCSEGVRLWYQSSQIWNVSKTLVKGEEEYSSVSPKAVSTPLQEISGRPANSQKNSKRWTEWKKSSGLNTTPIGSEGTSSKAAISTTMPLEYSPVRHRSAIERVLSALQGTDPRLDSATKVWTTFAVAKNFDIVHSPLEDYIIRWLRAYPNSYFLEVLPEASHQIADGLQNYDLARESFAILVGEEALDNLRHAREPRMHKRTTFGRKKEELPEHIHTRVEYASKSFLERINKDFAYMVDNNMQWINELPEVCRLSAYWQPELQDTVHKLKDLLKDYVRGAIYKVLCADYDTVPGPDLHNEGGHDLLPRLDRAAVWANMPLNERILSRTFWEALKAFGTLQGASNLDVQKGWSFKGGLHQLSNTEKREMHRGTYREIKKSELRTLVRNGQTHLDQLYIRDRTLYNAQHELDANFYTLPDRTINRAQDQKQPWDPLSTVAPDDIYNAQRQLNAEPLPKPSHVSPDRAIDGAQDNATISRPSFSTTTQPIDVPKPLKRTQDFHDALSPPDDKQSDTDIRTKWPFGAVRDDPVAQVLKSVDGLHVSALPLDRWPAAGNALEKSAGQGLENEGISTGIDPWRGYSDHLSHASEALQQFAPMTDLKPQKSMSEQEKASEDRQSSWPPKTQLTPTKAASQKRSAPIEPDVWADYNDSDGEGGVQRQLKDLRPKQDYLATSFFDLGRFFDLAQCWIDTFATYMLRSSDLGCVKESLDLGIVNTLVCLEDSEWKYLPLWAGGNDDGSMGVYNDDLPIAEHGFTTAGPEVHDGSTPANTVKAPSEFELVSVGDSASTFDASTATNRGFSDAVRRGHVHAADSVDDFTSDSFTMVTPSVDSDDEETVARKQIEAQERIEAAEEAAANEVRRMAKDKGKMVEEDENYADMFDGEEDEDGNDTDRAEVNDEDEEDEDMVMV
ncbi:MAG: hypothetical protein ASARMPRED_009336 [Alectoria sarmentosa]|nr:MAG: hypothetical protein ASARMPRED_009336 [Alectoria sarmentosa]